MNAQTWYRITGIARMIPVDDRDLEIDEEAVAGPRTWTWPVGSGWIRMSMIRLGAKHEPDDAADGDGDERPEDAGPQLRRGGRRAT